MNNRVTHGANEFYADLAGWTVSRVKEAYRDRLNVSYFAEALIDGHPSPVSAVLMPGQRLEFLKRFGIKGAKGSPRAIIDARSILRAYPEVTRLASSKVGRVLTDGEIDIAALVLQFCLDKFGKPPQEAVPVLEAIVKELNRQIGNLKDSRLTSVSLSDSERILIDVIRDADRRLTTGQVLKALDRAEKTLGESTVKTLLANLVKRGLMSNCHNCEPRGYSLPERPHDCGLDSVRTDCGHKS